MKIALIGATGFVGSVILREALDRGSVLSAEGADDNIMVRYKKEAFETKLINFDAVFDTIGGETMERSLKVLKQGGMLVSMVGQSNPESAQNAGVTVINQFTQTNTEVLQRLAQLVDTGIIKIRVGKMFPLEKYKEAFELLEEGHARGKVVLEITKG